MCNSFGRGELCVFGTQPQSFICTATQCKGVSDNKLLKFNYVAVLQSFHTEKVSDSERSFKAMCFYRELIGYRLLLRDA